jgi:hypothetical protein
MKSIAVQFGRSLDRDDFEATRLLLSDDCIYSIGEQVLRGPEAICHSYEKNMLEGRQKLDQLIWGDSSVEPINQREYFVHFTDYLTHKGASYTHRCKQRLTIEAGKIIQIVHVDDEVEQQRLNEFYRSVGLL